MGFALVSLKNYSAIRYFEVLTIPKQSDPGHEEALLGKGIVLFYLDNYTGSLSYFNKALSQRPNDFAALQNKGLVLFNPGDHLGAIKYLDAAIASNPRDASVYYNKGVILQKLGNFTGAIEYYDRALAISPNDKNVLDVLLPYMVDILAS